MHTSNSTPLPTVAVRPAVTDNPWFWAYLFGTAALVGVCLLGPKIDDLQQRRDANFTRRSELLEQQANPETVVNPEQAAPDVEPRYILFSPLYIALALATGIAWCIFWWQHFHSRPVPQTQVKLEEKPAS